MTWKHRNHLRSYLRSSLWIIPFCAIVLEYGVTKVVRMLDAMPGPKLTILGVEGAKAMMGAVVTLTLSLVVFTFASLLVAIQVACGQYTPRIIATTLLRDNVIRYTVGLFVFTFVFAIKSLDRTETTVPQYATYGTALLALACLVAFLFLIDYAARLLRPVTLVQRVGKEGLSVMESLYPEMLPSAERPAPSAHDPGPVERTILHHGTSAIVLAVNMEQLVAEAEKSGGVIEFAPRVGDFVGVDEPLFLLHGGAASLDEHALRGCVIFGSERTMEQDPLFALRILVDIAIKALSAAINDPTTAVLAIDQLHRLLRSAGRRNLRTEFVFGRANTLRLILRTPDWDEFVHLAFCEIRFYGVTNIQIARRLHAMIVNLANTLPAVRHPALREELDCLDRMIKKKYEEPEDLALALIPDSQGLGGSTEATAPKWGA
jgi:uncharacterized membrane protein